MDTDYETEDTGDEEKKWAEMEMNSDVSSQLCT